MRTYQMICGRNVVLALALVASLLAPSALVVQAATVVWSNGANTNVWNTAGDANFRTGGVNVVFNTNDVVSFQDQGSAPFPPGPTNGSTINIAIAGAGVSPTSLTMNRGFGSTTNFTGGDILTGAIYGTRDENVFFLRNGSYSFGGGTFVNQSGSNFRYQPTTAGTYQFGSGAITVGNGNFQFNPAAASTISNNFILTGAGSISGNANATFSGNLTVNSNLVTLPQATTFPFPSLTITQNTTLETTRCCGAAPVSQFTANILGTGTHNLTLQGSLGANADWQSRIDAPTTGWNVKDIAKTGRTMLYLNGDTSKFFDGMIANGGKFYHRGGNIRFTSATPNINFALLLDPAAAVIGVNPFETGAGFNTTTQLNIVSGGLLGGNGTVAADNNLNGGLPTFESNVNVVVNNGGQLSPGLSAGTLNVRGNVTLAGDTSKLVIELGGTSVGTQYDRLNVTGSLSLNGLLDVSFINGFGSTVLNSDSFTIVTAGSIGGLFDNLNDGRVVVADGSGSFLATINANNIILSNFEITPAPEPSTALLMGLGLVTLAARRRRKVQA